MVMTMSTALSFFVVMMVMMSVASTSTFLIMFMMMFVMMMLVLLMDMLQHFLHHIFQFICTFYSFQNGLTLQLLPWGSDNRCFRIMFTNHFYANIQLVLRNLSGSA